VTRAYIRLDPAFAERKADYPDGPHAALIDTFCLAELQPQRGRFRSLRYLAALLDKRGRHVPYLVEHGDIVVLEDGHVYVDGWDEWQEGDWKVGERVARVRSRQRIGVGNGPVTVGVTVENVRPHRLDLSDSAGAGGALTKPRADSGTPLVRAVFEEREGIPHITSDVQEAGESIAGTGILTAGDRQLTELDRLVETHGADAVIGAFRAIGKGTWRQLVWGAMKRLEPIPGSLSKVDAREAEIEAARRLFTGGAA
jgi:hypothetical protein